jgi:outer membrane protein insertion porin family
MIRLLLLACLGWGAVVAPRVALASPLAQVGGEIARIDIEGNRRIEEPTIRATLGAHRGDALTPSRVRAMIRGVHATGFFDDVQVYLAPDESGRGVVVTVRVVEKPAVRDVQILGAKKVKEEDVREAMSLRTFTVLNDNDLKRNVRLIRQKYVEKGYYLAEVEPVIAPIGDDQVDVTFKITENRKVVVQKVDLLGLSQVSPRKLKRRLQIKEGGILPWLGKAGTFDRTKLDTDRLILQSLLLEEGHLDATVEPAKVFLSPDKRFIYVSYQISEGTRYDFGRFAVVGDFVPDEGLDIGTVEAVALGKPVVVIQEEQYRAANGKKPRVRLLRLRSAAFEQGEPFRYSLMRSGFGVADNIEALYQDKGYAFAQVDVLPYGNPRTGQADVVLRVEKGDKYRIGQIHITGNDATVDAVIRREVQVDEGDLYRGARITASINRLRRLGFFDPQTVDVKTARGGAPDVLDLRVNVEEKPTGSFSMGMGFSSFEQFVLTGNIQKSNFLGRGYIVGAMINYSAIRRQGSLNFFDPYFLNSRWTLSVNAYSIQQQFQLNEYYRGGSVEVGRYLDRADDFRVSAQYTMADVGLLSIDPYRSQLLGGLLYRNGLTSTLGLNMMVDRRNNRMMGTKGTFTSVTANLSGGFRVSNDKVLRMLGGEFNFFEVRANFRGYYPLIPSDSDDLMVLRLNSTVGWVQSTDGGVVPFIHRYRVGGIMSIRGYNWFSLGPALRGTGTDDPVLGDLPLQVGGSQQWVNNLEIENPIVRAAGIRGVVFFDAGNAFGDPWGRGVIDPRLMRFSVGAGIRWASPMGLLRFEYGIPLAPREGERRGVFDFGMGQFF